MLSVRPLGANGATGVSDANRTRSESKTAGTNACVVFSSFLEPCSSTKDLRRNISAKTSTSASLPMIKPLTVWITTNCGKLLTRWDLVKTTWPASWETCIKVKKQQLELDMEQWTSSKLGKEYANAVCCHPAYLTSMQSTSSEMLGWRKHKLESR